MRSLARSWPAKGDPAAIDLRFPTSRPQSQDQVFAAMNSHALSVLEYPRSIELVAGRAQSYLGAERVREARPTTDLAWIEREHARVMAVKSLVNGDAEWRPRQIADIRDSLARLRVEGASLSAMNFVAVVSFLRASRLTADSLNDDRLPAISLALILPESAALLSAPREEKAIDVAISDDGEVRDDASPGLRRIRREMRGAQGELVKLLERLMNRLEANHQVSDMSVTVRNGRFVIPVRREARTSIGGIVHDTSSTGATLFVEPPAAVEAGNRIRELEYEESREVERVLTQLTEVVRPLAEPMAAALEAMITLDSLYARARFATEFGCGTIDFDTSGSGFTIIGGRHPMLFAQGLDVVPFDLVLSSSERTLLISGPNTGGKTVLLKSLGLFAALAQAGIPVPVATGSRLPVFDDVYADIGDEQSISSSLSTFSAHLKNLSEVLRSATSASLVLIDELGSGTDPVEGAALGGAILESLTARGALSVATTHLGALKELAAEVDGVVNASLQFDAVALAPTYRLIKGIPGRSYGLSIARRLALPEDVLLRAEARLPTGERDLTALLADLEAREQRLSETERENAAIGDDVRVRALRVAERELAIREKEKTAERDARRQARQLLLDARAEVDRTIQSLRSSSSEAAASAARDARRQIEHLAAAEGHALSVLDEVAPRVATGETQSEHEEIVVGAHVAVPALAGRTARVMELRDGNALVAMGSVKMLVPIGTLVSARPPSAADRIQVAVRGDIPEVEAKSEIDLRGMRAGEIEDILMSAVDSAVRADLKTLRIIHGKGTGALRERVTEMLRKETRVAIFRLGAWNEGGAGVTIAELA